MRRSWLRRPPWADTLLADLLHATTERTPVAEHGEVRRRREGEPKGGLPDITAAEIEDLDDPTSEVP